VYCFPKGRPFRSTTLRLTSSSSVAVYGTLTANGVTFTRSGPSYWRGISLLAGSGNSRLENCVIEYASGISISPGPVLNVQDASPTITGCTIRNSTATTGSTYTTPRDDHLQHPRRERPDRDWDLHQFTEHRFQHPYLESIWNQYLKWVTDGSL